MSNELAVRQFAVSISSVPIGEMCELSAEWLTGKQTQNRRRRSRIGTEGQVRGIMRMVEDDNYCVVVLNPIAAIQGALAAVSKKFLSRHLDTCVRSAVESDDVNQRTGVLEELRKLFARCGRVEKPKSKEKYDLRL